MIKLCTNCYWLGTKYCSNQYWEDDKVEDMKLCDEHNFKCSCKHGIKDEKEFADYKYENDAYCRDCLFHKLRVKRFFVHEIRAIDFWNIDNKFLCNVNEDVIHALVKIGYKIEELEY